MLRVNSVSLESFSATKNSVYVCFFISCVCIENYLQKFHIFILTDESFFVQSFSCLTKLVNWLSAIPLCLVPEGGRRGQRSSARAHNVVFPHSPSLKVSRAAGVSLSLTGDQLAERRMITASLAVIQPSHISMNCLQRSH